MYCLSFLYVVFLSRDVITFRTERWFWRTLLYLWQDYHLYLHMVYSFYWSFYSDINPLNIYRLTYHSDALLWFYIFRFQTQHTITYLQLLNTSLFVFNVTNFFKSNIEYVTCVIGPGKFSTSHSWRNDEIKCWKKDLTKHSSMMFICNKKSYFFFLFFFFLKINNCICT